MDTVERDNGKAPENQNPQVVSIQGETIEVEVSGKGPKSGMALARAIRCHAKMCRSRSEILHLEGCTIKAYRHAVSLLGRFPEKNAEAFGYYVMSVQAQIDSVEEAIDMALGRSLDKNGIQIPGDWKLLPALYRVHKDLRNDIFEMAMKLGIIQKAAEAVNLNLRDFTVGFGDEGSAVKPQWPEGPVAHA